MGVGTWSVMAGLIWIITSGFCFGAPYPTPKTVKLSGLFRRFDPTTGIPDASGLQELAAFEMAVNEINAHQLYPDLLPGIKISRAVRYLNGQFIDAVNQALDVNKWESDGMVGAATNELSNALAQINNGFEQNQVAYGSTGSYLSYIGPYPWYFRVCSDDAFQGTALADVIADNFPWRLISVFSTTGNDLGYGSDLYQQFQQRATQRKINIVSSHQFRSSLADLSDFIAKAKTAGTKVFVLLMQGPDAANLLTQGWEQGLFTTDTQILGSNQILGQETLQAFKADISQNIADILKGAMVLKQTTLNTFPTDKYKAWVARWKKQKQTVPNLSGDSTAPDYSEDVTKCVHARDNSTWNETTKKGFPLYYVRPRVYKLDKELDGSKYLYAEPEIVDN